MTHDFIVLQKIPKKGISRLANIRRPRSHRRRDVARVGFVLLVAAAAAVLDVILVRFFDVVRRVGAIVIDSIAWRR